MPNKNFLKVFQIYFNDAQAPLLDFTPYKNENCTVYFENSVIADLILKNAHVDSEYFGVVSYKLREKMGVARKEWKAASGLASTSEREFSVEDFTTELALHMPDCMSFQHHPSADTIATAEHFHPGFAEHFKHILLSIGYVWEPTVFENVFYCNYFVAKSDVYENYVKTMLVPAMKVMSSMPGLMRNSGYGSVLPDNLKAKFGVDHYPFHAFLCERLFSYYAHINKLRCLHY